MIRPTELRMGNWVDASDSEEVSPYQIGGNDFAAIIDEYFDPQPIPLTPEWLERLGFEKKGYSLDIFFIEYLEGFDAVEDKFQWTEIQMCLLKDKLYLYCEGAVIGNGFHHVHQLQNLYFALTGNELTPKV